MFILALSLLLAGSADDIPANLVNARVQTHSAASGLQPVFGPLAHAAGPAWIGYAVPVMGRHQMCCYRSTEIGTIAPGCRLENEGAYSINVDSDAGAWQSAPDFLVLFRVENGRVDRIRSLSRGCGIDVGGRPFHWITGVRAVESLELLESMVGTGVSTSKKKDKSGTDEPAMAAIAMHADPGADAVLDRLVAPRQPLGVRKQAAFWMGNSRGRRGYDTLRRLVADDASPEFREHAVFALSQSEVPEAVDTLVDIGRHDADAHVRGQALSGWARRRGARPPRPSRARSRRTRRRR